MIDMQLLNDALLALLIVVGASIALSLAMVAAATVSRPGQTPGGGTGRKLPRRPLPDNDYPPRVPAPDDYLPWAPVPDDRARELALR